MDSMDQQTTNDKQQTAEAIPNKIANSGLITLSLEDYYPKGERKHLDIAPWLFEGVMLREKDFRESVKNHDWSQYQGCYVSVDCSADAIIPQWAYMLLGAALEPHAKKSVFGSPEVLESIVLDEALSQTDFSEFKDQRVILKGCSKLPIPPHAYLNFVTRLKPLVKSLMFGEACSTVPVYKRKA